MKWILLLSSLAGCHARAPEGPPQPPPGQAWLSPKQLGDAQITIAAAGDHEVGGAIVTSGKVTFDDLRVAHVFSPVTGRVTQILAQPGQRVKKGSRWRSSSRPTWAARSPTGQGAGRR